MLPGNQIEVTLERSTSISIVDIATQIPVGSNAVTTSGSGTSATAFLDQLPLLAFIGQFAAGLPAPILQQVVLAYEQLLADSPELILDVSDILLRLPPVNFQNPLTLDVTANAGAYSQMIAFGDSLTDTGNLSGQLAGLGVTFPPVPYAPGRLADGPLWIDYVAADLSAAGGLVDVQPVNNAIIGSTTGRGNVAALTAANAGSAVPPPLEAFLNQLPGIQDQVDLFTNTVGTLDPNALYVIWGGANDSLTVSGGAVASVNAVLDAVENIADSVITLAAAGAKTIAVANLPNLGLTPNAVVQDLVAEATTFSTGFNLLLQGTLGALEGELGIDLIQIDVFSLGQAIAQRPSEFGFTNTSDPLINVLATGGTPNPSEFVFMDGFHPTTAFHRLVADVVGQAVTQPTPGAVLPTALSVASGFLSGVDAALLAQLTDLLSPLVGLPEPPIGAEPQPPSTPGVDPMPPSMPMPSESMKLFGTHMSETLEGSTGHDYLYGNGGADTLVGGPGNDHIYGSDAAEMILAGLGDDAIYSNGGLDIIDSGDGLDHIWLAGNSGATVKLGMGNGHDRIINYQAGSTRLQVMTLEGISAANGSAGLEIWQSGDLLAVIAHQTTTSFDMGSLFTA